jgi:hypothetical protein
MKLPSMVKKVALATTLAIISITFAAAADTPSPFIGKWVLNIQKSNFGSDPPLKSNVFTITDPGDGTWHTIIDYVDGDAPYHAEYTTTGDGKAVPVTGNAEADSVAFTKVDSSTVKFVFKKSGKTVEWGSYTVSKDGKSLRGPLSGKDPDGKPWKWHYVFERQ